jgi:hypothetical protein
MTDVEIGSDVLTERPDDPVFVAAARLCQELVRGTVRPPQEVQAGGVLVWARRLTGGDPLGDLARLRADLAGPNRRPVAVMRFARFLEQRGYDGLCTVTLSYLHRLCPADPGPPAMLARLFLARARRVERGAGARLRDYDRFFRYADRALPAAGPGDPLRGMRTAAAVEVTILKGHYDAA